jgi:hypothetical protein
LPLEIDSWCGLCHQESRRTERQGSGCGATMEAGHQGLHDHFCIILLA